MNLTEIVLPTNRISDLALFLSSMFDIELSPEDHGLDLAGKRLRFVEGTQSVGCQDQVVIEVQLEDSSPEDLAERYQFFIYRNPKLAESSMVGPLGDGPITRLRDPDGRVWSIRQ